MDENDSFATFRRTIDKRYQAFRTALDHTLAYFADGNNDLKLAKAKELQKASHYLQDILDEQDRPAWLNPIQTTVDVYLRDKSKDSARSLLSQIAAVFSSVRPISLRVEAESPYDFDRLYARLREQCQIPQLFEKLVQEITSIIESGEVETVTVLSALRQMVAVLKANRGGSYASTIGSFNFVTFVNNFIVIALKRIPGIKEAVEAYQETIKEAETAFQKLEQDLRDEMQTVVIERLPNLERVPLLIETQHAALPTPKLAKSSMSGETCDASADVEETAP